jgi:hypothetical protein
MCCMPHHTNTTEKYVHMNCINISGSLFVTLPASIVWAVDGRTSIVCVHTFSFDLNVAG